MLKKNIRCPAIDYMMFGYLKEGLVDIEKEEDYYIEDDQES